MSDANNSEPDSNLNNKENESQGNNEDITMITGINTMNMNIDNKDEEEENDEYDEYNEEYLENICSSKNFDEKYRLLRGKWAKGCFDGNRILNEKEKPLYKGNEYLLPFINDNDDNNNNDNNKKDVSLSFHPSYSYSYTNYDKETVLPLLQKDELISAKKRFKEHIDRLEMKILIKLKEKEIARAKEKEEKEKKEKEKEKSVEGNNGWVVPKYCIPIRADIRSFDFKSLAIKQKELSGRLFDVIMTDPPWMLASSNPTRGVALGYSQLGDNIISNLPIQLLQENGLLFMWIINAKYRLALELFTKWGYKMIADIAWVKQTVNRRIANGHGFYLQHAKETCLIGLKGDLDKIPTLNKNAAPCSDVIYSERRGQSQKPEEVYQYIENLVPRGFYMEIFGRRNNLRNGWLTIGNEL